MIIKIKEPVFELNKNKIYLFVSNYINRDDCWYVFNHKKKIWQHKDFKGNKIYQIYQIYNIQEDEIDIMNYIRTSFRTKERYRSPYLCDSQKEIKKFLLIRKLGK